MSTFLALKNTLLILDKIYVSSSMSNKKSLVSCEYSDLEMEKQFIDFKQRLVSKMTITEQQVQKKSSNKLLWFTCATDGNFMFTHTPNNEWFGNNHFVCDGPR